MVWHQRPGHPSISIFQHLLRHQHLPLLGSASQSNFCESCQLGKSKQLPFSESIRSSLSPLEVIHSDLWTSPVPSLSGSKYYVLFIDEYSRFTWLYPIMNKSDVFKSFIKFKLLVENLFSTTIKYLQIDNGGEYTSTNFKEFLSQHRIFHRLTCPHTSQQNGIVEKKHRHIVETGLTLLAQSKLPPKYWVDSFLTSIFLTNQFYLRLSHNIPHPSSNSSRKNQITHSSEPLVASIIPYFIHMLHISYPSRSKPYIFLRYGANQHGYRCLDPHSQKVYLSRNVVFDESNFPVKTPSLSQGSCKITTPPGAPILFQPATLSHLSLAPPSNPAPASPNPVSYLPPTPLPTTAPTSPSLPTPLPPSPPLDLIPFPILAPPLPDQLAVPSNCLVTRFQTGSSKPRSYPASPPFMLQNILLLPTPLTVILLNLQLIDR
jgi:hypothetical protein